MAIVVLPKTSDPNGTTDAQSRLQAEIDDPFSAVMIILGEGPPINRVVEVGTARASTAPLRRRVVWVPDTGVLTKQQLKDYSPAGEVAVFIGLDNTVKSRLALVQAQIPLMVEQGFTNAGG
jgi:hypothetical protein